MHTFGVALGENLAVFSEFAILSFVFAITAIRSGPSQGSHRVGDMRKVVQLGARC